MTNNKNKTENVAETVKVEDVKELETVIVTGGFRGGYRTIPEHEENGVKYPERTQFKMSRRVMLKDGSQVRQTVWIPEADAKAWGLQEGVRYTLKLEVGTDMVASKGNGSGQYLDEYALFDPQIIEVNGVTTPPLA